LAKAANLLHREEPKKLRVSADYYGAEFGETKSSGSLMLSK
jgi:hypothetical protein